MAFSSCIFSFVSNLYMKHIVNTFKYYKYSLAHTATSTKSRIFVPHCACLKESFLLPVNYMVYLLRKSVLLFVFIRVGGCGAMYEIFVESEDFRGKRQVQQHRLVNKVSILY